MGITTDRSRHARTRRTRVQLAALLVGAVFLVIGILGFIPGITTDYGTMTFSGYHSDARIFGIFEVSILHNIVHLLFGVAGLAAATRVAASRVYLIGGGIIYLVLWLYGLSIDKFSPTNFIPVNTADDWLHFVLGVGMIVLGVVLGRQLGSAYRHRSGS